MFRILFVALALSVWTSSEASVLTWDDVEQMPPVQAGQSIAYGSLHLQFGELRVPSGKGPFPVAVLIHGGCWLSEFDRSYFNPMAVALAKMGVATWTIEYRRVGDEGGGWPGTFSDVAKALDFLPRIAKAKSLNLKRVIVVGHSAGGQLALWAAARHKLPSSSALYVGKPLPLSGVIGLASISNLETYRLGEPGSCHSVVDELLGGSPKEVPTRYAETSPRALLPLGVPQRLFQGVNDTVVSMDSVADYVAAAQAAGDAVVLTKIPRAGHFEPALPQAPAWSQVQMAVRQLLEIR